MSVSFNILAALAGVCALAFSGAARPSQAQQSGPEHPAAPAGTQNTSAFTYQGQLRKNGAPVNGSCSATFKLFDAASGGVQAGPTVTTSTLTVANGLFTLDLDFGWTFTGEARWLEAAIGCGEAAVTLAPRTPLRPAPYAFALPGMRTVPGNLDFGDPTMNVIGGVFSGAVSNTISADSFNSVVAGGTLNRIDNLSTYSAIGGGNGNGIDKSYNSAIGGGDGNLIQFVSVRSAIGGGTGNRIDNVSGYSAIGGGGGNRIDHSSDNSAIGGGANNRIDNSSFQSAIGGGNSNRIDNDSNYGAIAGGGNNRIDNSSPKGAIGGGHSNVITNAAYATIPGGYLASATQFGQQAYAAGGFNDEVGTAQASLYVLRNNTTNATTTTLFLDGISNEIQLPVGRAMLFDIQLIGESDSTGPAHDMAAYKFQGAFNRYSPTSASLGQTKTVLYEDAGATFWDASLEKVDASGTLRLRVTGNTGRNIRWVAVVRTTEVAWAPNLGLLPAQKDK